MTWKDKTFSVVEIYTELWILVMLYLSNLENTESYGKEYVHVHSWYLARLWKLYLKN